MFWSQMWHDTEKLRWNSACLYDEKLLSASLHYGDTVCWSQEFGTGKCSEKLCSPAEIEREGVKVCVFLDTGVV